MSGDTLEEIAEKLGYKNHSGVLKRIRKIGQAYEAYTGVDYGFESGKSSDNTYRKSVGVILCPNGGGDYEMENIPVPARPGQQTGAPAMLLL